MNFLNVFEQRVGGLFGATAQGITAPFSFKKLAKKAAREMEAETFVVNGVDTAPALYTILVSSEDDITMRPLYAQLTSETAQFIEGQAQGKGYVFVGKPLVRFMADPSLKSGKFSVFAENVDATTLARLREEEARFLGADSSLDGGLGGAAAQQFAQPAAQPFAAPAQQFATPAAADSSLAGFDVLPQESVMDAEQQLYAQGGIPAGGIPEVNPSVTPVQPVNQPAAQPAAYAAPAAAAGVAAGAAAGYAAQQAAPAAPQTVRVAPAAPAPAAAPITCLLIDRKSGRTFTGNAPRVVIGRERTPGGIVVHDPNVSRAHAELSFDGQSWRIRDLNSTNGTLVNDVDVDECALRDGDLITLGLTNLEFREN